MKITNFSKFLAVAFAASSLMLTSCGTDPVAPVPVVKDYAKVMLFHGATDAAAVNLQIDGATKGDSIKYGVATAYNQVELTAGKKIAVSSLVAKSGVKIATDSSLMNKDVGYSYFVYQENDAAKTVGMIKKVDNLALPTSGNGKIRLAYLVPDYVGGVDMEAVKPSGVTTANNSFTNIKFKDLTDFVDLPKGTYDLAFKLNGQINKLFTATNVVIEDGKIYTIAVRGYVNVAGTRAAGVTVIPNN